MCLYKTHKWPKVAWKPITVYKDFSQNNLGLFSIFQYANYEVGKVYYSRRPTIFGIVKNTIKAEGIHSYQTLSDAVNNKVGDVIVKCTIPRFSLYYIGDYGDIASGRIIINKIIEQL